jgi:hypothetical protein
MKEYYIGLDVHKDSVFMVVLDDRKVRSSDRADSDVVGTKEVPTNSPQLIKAIKGYQGKVFAAYEAGCLGLAGVCTVVWEDGCSNNGQPPTRLPIYSPQVVTVPMAGLVFLSRR